MLKDSPIIILDEATANVDPENEQELMEAMQEITHEKTVIMIAHRLSTVTNADCIYVLAEGKIAESGTHEQLLEKDSIYKHMWSEYNKSVNWQVGKAGVSEC